MINETANKIIVDLGSPMSVEATLLSLGIVIAILIVSFVMFTTERKVRKK